MGKWNVYNLTAENLIFSCSYFRPVSLTKNDFNDNAIRCGRILQKSDEVDYTLIKEGRMDGLVDGQIYTLIY